MLFGAWFLFHTFFRIHFLGIGDHDWFILDDVVNEVGLLSGGQARRGCFLFFGYFIHLCVKILRSIDALSDSNLLSIELYIYSIEMIKSQLYLVYVFHLRF